MVETDECAAAAFDPDAQEEAMWATEPSVRAVAPELATLIT
jgi:hypothetical protein